MADYTINVGEIEELQTIQNTDQLENIFERAKSAIIQGGSVHLVRLSANGQNKFDQITTEEDLANYKSAVFRYLNS
jgi:hypothetical protein